jgi:protein-tyrosine phosphatase
MTLLRPALLFVCMGNICRSPTAEGVFRAKAARAGILEQCEVDSAGTHGYHINEAPDPRAIRAARERGYDISLLRGRRVSAYDCSHFDYLLAMDHDNREFLLRLCPAEHQHKVQLLMAFAQAGEAHDVPDPYYGGKEGFERVLDLVENACDGLLDALLRRRSSMS